MNFDLYDIQKFQREFDAENFLIKDGFEKIRRELSSSLIELRQEAL